MQLRPATSISLIVAACLLAIALPASAQPGGGGGGRGGPRLAPEKAEAAWALEAKSVAKELKLAEEPSGKVADAYKAARKSYQEGTEKLRKEAGDGGDRMAMMQGFMDLRIEESGKLEAALKPLMDEAQLKSAMASLGGFNPMWDQMADTLAEFKLADDKLDAALGFVRVHIEKVNAAQAEAMETMDFQSIREKGQELKQKLDEEIKGVLAADQFEKWTEKTAQRRRQGGGPGGGLRRREGGPGAPPPADAKPNE